MREQVQKKSDRCEERGYKYGTVLLMHVALLGEAQGAYECKSAMHLKPIFRSP
ncbi:hypothetical protein L208DRAFT_1411513, partial [Tricholoma matsutake]